VWTVSVVGDSCSTFIKLKESKEKERRERFECGGKRRKKQVVYSVKVKNCSF